MRDNRIKSRTVDDVLVEFYGEFAKAKYGEDGEVLSHYAAELRGMILGNRICKPIETTRCLHGTDCPAWLCSECGELFEEGTNFCSNCGAKVINS